MSILRRLIRESKINSNEKTRWKKKEIIPCEVLCTLWKSGIHFETKLPQTGMGLKRFLELIWQFVLSCPDNKISAEALNLFEDTVQHELMPNWRHKIKPKKPRIIWPNKTEKPESVRPENLNT
jgi:hypothetical protein